MAFYWIETHSCSQCSVNKRNVRCRQRARSSAVLSHDRRRGFKLVQCFKWIRTATFHSFPHVLQLVNSAMEVKVEPNLNIQEPDKVDKETAAADSDVGSSGDDSVFEEMEEGNHLERPTVVAPRTRRVSDVIDSLGSKEEPIRSMSTPERLRPRAMSVSSSGYGTPGPAAETPADWLSHSQPTDVTDALPMNQTAECPSIETKAVEAAMPVEKDADEYNMNHCKRGKAVIFNHDVFDDDRAPPRSGSHVDVDSLCKTYSALEFEVTVHNNLPYTKIKEVLDELANEDHRDEDCLVIVVLTHGMGTSYIHSRDVPYPVNTLWDAFVADKCTTLAGKPKMFIIQACRGTRLDPGVLLRRPSRTEADSSPPSYKIPSHADFLIAYSSMEGFYSWRNPDKGTWFIQSLCKELFEHSATMDLLEMMTRISRRVALEYESYNDEVPWQHEQKQIPSITTMLIRKVYFRPKV